MEQKINVSVKGKIESLPAEDVGDFLKLIAVEKKTNNIEIHIGAVSLHRELLADIHEEVQKVLGGCRLGIMNDKLTFFGKSMDYGRLPVALHEPIAEEVRKKLVELKIPVPETIDTHYMK